MKKLILRAISMGLSVASVVLLILNEIEEKRALILLGLGLFCLTLSIFDKDLKNTTKR